MSYTIQSIDLFVREMPQDRMSFTVGRKISAKNRRPRAIFLVRLKLNVDGNVKTIVGRSGDRPSFGWLDKRSDRTPEEKLAALISLVKKARTVYLENGASFETPFAIWKASHEKIMAYAKAESYEALSATYASALFERALIDAVCRAERLPFFEMVRDGKLGIDPGAVHPELKDFDVQKILPLRQRSRFFIRHTVGLADPISERDLEKRIGDGEPETLQEYVKRDGLRFFKVKISGDIEADLARLNRIWLEAVVRADQPTITLDGNEAYKDIDEFYRFVTEFEKRYVGLFQHTAFIEQPLTRQLTHDPKTAATIRKISALKPLLIDEADGTVDSFKNAFVIGYSGTSHKNCKGVFKSILNRALCFHFADTTGRDAFISGEDLSNMPIVPLHQDFDTLSLLDISHTERNGHHYGFGLSHLTALEKMRVAKNHPDLYVKRGDELFLNIRNGAVDCGSVLGAGFGGDTLPDWDSLTPLDDWKPE